MCLIPEVPFSLAGKGGLIAHVSKIIEKKGHAVVCVAEGAGQDLLSGSGGGGPASVERDASGNPILADVGPWLKAELKKGIPDADIKLIDPSYTIRSVRSFLFCLLLLFWPFFLFSSFFIKTSPLSFSAITTRN